jgi:hypothetical protein
MAEQEEGQSWRDIVRSNNEPGSPNIVLTLEDASKEVTDNPDRYNKAFVVLYHNEGKGDAIMTSWFNAGLRYSEIVFLLEYMKHEFISAMKYRPE